MMKNPSVKEVNNMQQQELNNLIDMEKDIIKHPSEDLKY